MKETILKLKKKIIPLIIFAVLLSLSAYISIVEIEKRVATTNTENETE